MVIIEQTSLLSSYICGCMCMHACKCGDESCLNEVGCSDISHVYVHSYYLLLLLLLLLYYYYLIIILLYYLLFYSYDDDAAYNNNNNNNTW